MKHIFIIHAHWNNRGDEAAVRAITDALLRENMEIEMQVVSPEVHQFPYKKEEVSLIPLYPRFRNIPEFLLACVSGGKTAWTKEGKHFFESLRKSELILHAPGGPSLGDTYSCSEILYLLRYMAILRMRKPFIICAPSVGPFKKNIRNYFRKKIFNAASRVILREQISQKYLNQLLPEKFSIVTLDAAFQNEIDEAENEEKLGQYRELSEFLKGEERIIGVTITDLLWHPVLGKEKGLSGLIKESFMGIIKRLVNAHYKVLFIPQLFGMAHDISYMKQFERPGCFTMSEEYDCYFQQYIIGKMYALIGMRYHSNIFSAKMEIPFLSISYEQKMRGFVKRINYEDYCIDIKELSAEKLMEKFRSLEENHEKIKEHLHRINPELRKLSYETTNIVLQELKSEKYAEESNIV